MTFELQNGTPQKPSNFNDGFVQSFTYNILDSNNLWPTDTGLWGSLPNKPPDKNGKLINGANASLQYKNYFIGLWINEIDVDFSLSGNTAQGPFTQDFYPHNVVTPSIAVTGQTTNVGEKNRLADFIRFTHSQIIKTASNNPNSLITFTLHTNGQKNTRTQKGSPSPFKVYGFIDSIPFGAQQFVTAYTYQFNFSVAYTGTNANSSNKFLGLNFTPDSVADLQTITQWATDPNNKSIFEQPPVTSKTTHKSTSSQTLSQGVANSVGTTIYERSSSGAAILRPTGVAG